MLIYDEPFADYLSSGSIGSTDVRRYARSPQLFLDGRNGMCSKKTKSMDFGTAFHCAVLEPERYQRDYTASPVGLDMRTTAGKKWKAENEHKTCLNWADGQRVKHMASRCPPEIRALLDGKHEVTCRTTIDGVSWQCRPDVLGRNHKVDLKTIMSLEKITSHIWTYRYDVQEAFYDWVLAREGWTGDSSIVFAETAPPYRWARVTLDSDYRCRADTDTRMAVSGIIELLNGKKPEPEWRDIHEPLPDWAANDEIICSEDEEEEL